ncbi:HAD family hydrolase [Allokutzneria sp. NRRL B-24872]|uniref:HAD family hydrolase n=1 Tax=Allokutzneria sp. NRRL B-24872 TaxID=1137961 RepID=UPI001FEF7697|nr:HAD family phosphatase [Allokutzneria sp. NRRL B-24872]
MGWIVFDYGEVLSRRSTMLPKHAEVYGVTEQEFAPAYWKVRDAYDRGQPDLEYWRAVGAELGVEVDEETSAALTEADISGWLELDPDSVVLLDELAEAGVPLALLSNAPTSFAATVREQSWAKRFRHLVFSGELGVAKPDAEIWAALLDQLGAPAADCLFLDDRQVNVDGARRAGLDAELWAGAAAIRPRLRELGVLPS